MNLDELQSIRDRERQSDSLQQLREDFYVEVGEFVQELRDEREAAAERADDPFDAPEVNRITDDIKTAEQTVEAIYERRVGKLVKMASFAAADMPTEDEGLTGEERELFERMVGAIEDNRDTVMRVIDGEAPTETAGSTGGEAARDADSGRAAESADARDEGRTPDTDSPETVPSTGADGVDAADLMAGSDTTREPNDRAPTSETDGPDRQSAGTSSTGRSDPETDESRAETGTGRRTPGAPDPDGEETATGTRDVPPEMDSQASPDVRNAQDADATSTDGSGATTPAGEGRSGIGGASGTDESGSTAADTEHGPDGTVTDEALDSGEAGRETGASPRAVDRETVRITDDVGQIFGVDEREYDLTREDVVTLPTENATPLVERDVAERLDGAGDS